MKSVDDKLAAIAGEKLLSLQVAQANIRSTDRILKSGAKY